MRSRMIGKVGRWFFGGAVTCCLVYSIVVLAAQPARASSNCTSEDCSDVHELAAAWCQHLGGVRSVSCALDKSMWDFVCVQQTGGQTGTCPVNF